MHALIYIYTKSAIKHDLRQIVNVMSDGDVVTNYPSKQCMLAI